MPDVHAVTEIFPVIIAACLVNNLVLENLLGVNPLFAVSRAVETAMGMALAVLVVMPPATFACHLLHRFVLEPARLEYLALPLLVSLILICTRSIEGLLQKFRPSFHEAVSSYIPMLLVNAALLGAGLLATEQRDGLLSVLFFSFSTALGYAVILVVFSAARKRISFADVPDAFEGPAVLLVTLAIMSMAFMGFTGIAE